MTASIKLYTDSSAQLPRHVTAALDLEVVPIGISIDGASHDESDLDVDLFYTCLAAGSRATTSQPSPDRFAAAYEAAAASCSSYARWFYPGLLGV